MDERQVKVYLLWFHEWEANNLLGIFETKERADMYRKYFLAHPQANGMFDMEYYSKKEHFENRICVSEVEIGHLDTHVVIDNLKFLEMFGTPHENPNP